MRRWLLLLPVLATALAACGSARPTSPPDDLACGLEGYAVADGFETFKVFAIPGKAAKTTQAPKEVNVLELSAGGEYGAYGAGFLAGWGKVGTAARPAARKDIQVVTGVSTGALMATHVFLGDFDDDLVTFYANLSDDQIYSVRSKFALIQANSLYDTAGKKALLKSRLTSELIDRVAQQPDDRRLYIGFANIDTGRFMRIDMVKLAKGIADKAHRDDCYRGVIDAATAVEVAFPPVFIDGQMLGDGGVRHHLFVVDPSNLEGGPPLAGLHFRLFSLVHGDLDVSPPPAGGVTNGVLQIAERAGSIFTDQTLKDSIILSNVLASHPELIVGTADAKKLPRFTPYFAAAAEAACTCKAAADVQSQCGGTNIFCRPYMRCLAQAGDADGRDYASRGKWLTIEKLHLGSTPAECPSASGVKLFFR